MYNKTNRAKRLRIRVVGDKRVRVLEVGLIVPIRLHQKVAEHPTYV